MFERAASHERAGRENVFSTKLGGNALTMMLSRPEGAPSGVVIPVISGLASGPELHGPVAEQLTRYGHIVARVWQEGASEHGVRASKYVFQALEQGDFNGRSLQLPDRRKIFPLGHSLGARKAAKGLLQLREAGDTTIDRAILQAPACLGGVHPILAPVDAAKSIHQEIKHITVSGAIEHRRVALEGLRSLWALRGEIVKELHEAMHDTIESDVALMQATGVEFVAIDHPHDALVSSARNQATYRRLHIPYIEVADVPQAGHNVQLYYPHQTARAINEAQAVLQGLSSTAA